MKTNPKLSFKLCFAFLLFPALVSVAQQPLTPPAQDYVLNFYGNEVCYAPQGEKLNLGGSFTMETWLFLNDSAVVGAAFLGSVVDPCGADPVTNYALETTDNSTRILFSQSTGLPGSRRTILSSKYLKVKTWNHVAATLANNTMKLFINGVEAGSQVSPGIPRTNTFPFTVGGRACANSWGGGYTGSLREVRIWDHALTSSQLVAKAGAVLSGTEPGLISNWRLDEGYGEIAHDYSTNNYHLKFGSISGGYFQFPKWITPAILENNTNYLLKTYPTNGIQDISKIALLDFDNDNDLDIIGYQGPTNDWSTIPLLAYRNNGLGNFLEVSSDIFIPQVPKVIISSTFLTNDFNNDNRSDLFICGAGADIWPWSGEQSQLFLQRTDNKLINVTATHLPQIKDGNTCASSADVDKDGDMDIYIGAGIIQRLYINDGTGHFKEENQRLPFNVEPLVAYGGHTFIDVDGDGVKDIILGAAQQQHSERYTLLKNNGKGYFSYSDNPLAMPLRSGSPEWYTQSITSADLNGDGFIDFVSIMSDNISQSLIQLVINNGDGTFRDASFQLPLQPWPTGYSDPIASDLNGDGLIDLAIPAASPLIYLNRGNGIFCNASEFISKFFNTVYPIMPADVNNDGRMDLILAQNVNLVILENLKNIALSDLILPTFTKLSKVTGADGDTIRITGTNFSGTSAVHFGQKNATFQLVSESEILAVVPKYARNGKITVTTPKSAVASDQIFSTTASTAKILLSNTKAASLAGIGSYVGIFSTEDPGEIYSHTYSLVAGNGTNDTDNAKFRIVGDTLQTNSILSLNSRPEYHINVKYLDTVGAQATKAFVITTETDGLIAYYPFNGNANDESGSKHNGTPFNVTLTTDQYGNSNSAYYFNGTDSKITIGNHLGLLQSTGSFTFTAWINCDEMLPDPQYTILAERAGGENYQFHITGNRFEFDYLTGGVPKFFSPIDKLTSKQWYFAGVTYDGSTVNIYLDGVLIKSYPATGPIDNNPGDLIIGQIYDNSGVFKGKLDEIAIYNKALSAERIKSLYACSSPKGGKVTGNVTICPKTSTGVLTLSGNTGNVMEWQKKSGSGPWVSIPSTNQTYSEIPGPSGTYYYRTVTQSGTCDIKYSEPDTVTVKAVELGISQSNNVLTANATPAICQWINCATHAPIAGQTNQSYTATVNGSYAVKITQNGCTDTSACVSLINPFPDNGGTISGTATVCQGQNSVTYTIPAIANATTYLWTLPSGATGSSTTSSINVNYGSSAVSGNISVKGHNATGDGASSTLAIIVNPLPASAGTITGAASICPGQNSVSYSVPVISNASSYIWTLPTGATGTSVTNSISVDYGTSAISGNITVKGQNECGDGTQSSLAVTVNPKPATPVVTQTGNTLHSSASNGNQWYNSNSLIGGATNQDYTFTATGKYTVVVTLNGCASDTSTTNVITGSEQMDFSKKIVVYPNPVSDDLTIEYSGNFEEVRFTIVNLAGQLLFDGKLLDKTVVHTSSFAAGLYFIKFDVGKTVEFKKVIKN